MNGKPTATLGTKNKTRNPPYAVNKRTAGKFGFYLVFPTFLTAILIFNASKENKFYT